MKQLRKITRQEFVHEMIDAMPRFDLYYRYNHQPDLMNISDMDCIDWMNKLLDFFEIKAKVIRGDALTFDNGD